VKQSHLYVFSIVLFKQQAQSNSLQYIFKKKYDILLKESKKVGRNRVRPSADLSRVSQLSVSQLVSQSVLPLFNEGDTQYKLVALINIAKMIPLRLRPELLSPLNITILWAR